MRDYGKDTETIWNGDSECEHVWCDTIKNPKADYRTKEDMLRQGATVGNTINQNEFNPKTMGSFCQKCGAYKCQLGLEAHPNLYIEHLVTIFREVKRVLKKSGSFYLNLGDTYFGSGAGTDKTNQEPEGKHVYKLPYGSCKTRCSRKKGSSWLQPKQLMLIPMRVAIALQDDGWILRNSIIWHRPNTMPSSADDRFTVDFEYVFFFVKNRKYYFKQQFEPYTKEMNRWGGEKLKVSGISTWDKGTKQTTYRDRDMRPNPQGKNKRTTWSIPTVPSSELHFAQFPESLLKIPIDAGCPKYICKSCSMPRIQIRKSIRDKIKESKIINKIDLKGGKYTGDEYQTQSTGETHRDLSPDGQTRGMCNKTEIIGLSNCDCGDDFDSGIVLDIFAGSGTTCLVAKQLGRRYIGFDISEEYCRMARKRVARHVSINKWVSQSVPEAIKQVEDEIDWNV